MVWHPDAPEMIRIRAPPWFLFRKPGLPWCGTLGSASGRTGGDLSQRAQAFHGKGTPR
jgi:hypothetical protein